MSDIHTEFFDIFCSYHRKNKGIVFKIYDKLQEYFSIWIDPDQKESAQDIEDAIKTSTVVICFITKTFLKVNNCVTQIQSATKLKKIRVAIMLEKNIPKDLNVLIDGYLKFKAFEHPNLFEPWSDELYNGLFNIISDLVNKRKLQFDSILEAKFLPFNLNQVIQNKTEPVRPRNEFLLKPHVLKLIIETSKPIMHKLTENISFIITLSNGNLFVCNGHGGFSIYNENYAHIKTMKQIGGCCSKTNIFCYFAASNENSIICCCEIKPWNTEPYYALLTTDFDLKKLKISSTYDNESHLFQYFQGIHFSNDWLYVSSSVDIIKFSKSLEFKSSYKLEFEPNEIALVNDVLCVTKHKSIIFYDIDTFYVKYRYSSKDYLNYEISVMNNYFYIFCEFGKLFCYEADGKQVDTAKITLNDDICKNSRGRIIYFKDKVLVQTNDSNVLYSFELKNIMN